MKIGFFTDDKGNPSMSRLLCFLAFWPATYVVIKTLTSDTLGWYLSAYAAAYVGGKFGDSFKPRGNKNDDVSNQ